MMAREMGIMKETLEQGTERSMISKCQETGTMGSGQPYSNDIRET